MSSLWLLILLLLSSDLFLFSNSTVQTTTTAHANTKTSSSSSLTSKSTDDNSSKSKKESTSKQKHNVRCDAGQWVDNVSSPLSSTGRYAHTGYNPKNTSKGVQTWLSHACPVQTFEFSCYYHETFPDNFHFFDNQTGRSTAIARRGWKPKHTQCQHFHIHTFLHLLQNKQVLFVGDSVMLQIWTSLVCTLFSASKTALSYMDHIDISWTNFRDKDTYICPKGIEHCFVIDGHVHVLQTNTTFYAKTMDVFQPHTFQQLLHNLSFTSNDVLIFNNGLHINDEHTYREVLHNVTKSFHQINHTEDRLHHVFFLETTPQHFGTMNGFYNYFAAFYLNSCVPIDPYFPTDDWKLTNITAAISSNTSTSSNTSSASSSASSSRVKDKTTTPKRYLKGSNHQEAEEVTKWLEHVKSLDWRNRVAKEAINNYTTSNSRSNNIELVYLAEALYSQFDAHIDHAAMNWVKTVDCTHWCQPSGVLDFIHQAIYNSLLDHFSARDQ